MAERPAGSLHRRRDEVLQASGKYGSPYFVWTFGRNADINTEYGLDNSLLNWVFHILSVFVYLTSVFPRQSLRARQAVLAYGWPVSPSLPHNSIISTPFLCLLLVALRRCIRRVRSSSACYNQVSDLQCPRYSLEQGLPYCVVEQGSTFNLAGILVLSVDACHSVGDAILY